MSRCRWEYLLISILVFILCSELIWQVAPLFDHSSYFSMSSSRIDQESIVNYSMHANVMLDAKILLIPMLEEPAFGMPIYVFYDPEYPAIHTSWERVHMLWTSLKGEMFLRGFKGEITLVSAEDLENVMSNKEKAVIIMASGGFPSNVFSRDKDLVRPWLDSGGVLMWFGFYTGYYTVYKGQVENSTFDLLPQHLREEGIAQIGLGNYIQTNPFNGTLTTAQNSTSLSNLLEINFNIIDCGLLVDRLSQEGLVLGNIGGNPAKTSVSVVSVGMGKIVVFGFFVLGSYILNGPELSARDIAQILDSGIIYASKSLMPVYEEHRLLAGESFNGQITVETNSSIKGIVVYAYSTTTSNAFLFQSEFIPSN